jgi:SPP1 family predicted phage head-tail adaptor
MDRKVLIEVLDASTTTPSGQKIKGWATHASWWCNLRQESSGEGTSNNQMQGSTRYVLRGRYVSGVTHQMRINDDGIYYYVVGVRTEGRKEMTIINAEFKDSDQANIN